MAQQRIPDLLIVGAGVMGAVIAYESARRGLRVRILERAASPGERDHHSATGGSLGGLFWIGIDDATASLGFEGLERHRLLSAEIGADTSFRPHSVLSLAVDEESLAGSLETLEKQRRRGFIGQQISAENAVHLEPALDPRAIAGGLLLEQGLIDPAAFTRAMLAAAARYDAEVEYGIDCRAFAVERGRCTGVETDRGAEPAGQVVVAAGAWSAPLLASAGVDIPVLHTHDEYLETDALPPSFFHIVTQANARRKGLERAMSEPQYRARWARGEDAELLPHTVDFDLAQHPDGRVHIGQVTRAIPAYRPVPAPDSEGELRAMLRKFFPTLADILAKLRLSHVAISADGAPVAGPVPGIEGLHVVSGLPSPLIFAPALAERIAGLLSGEPQPDLAVFDPGRFR